MHPSTIPNKVLWALKWPIALLSVVLFAGLHTILSESALTRITMDQAQAFVMGASLYFVAWLLIFRHPFSGSYFSTFEHELTHALFAWATLHRVTGLTVTWSSGGACTYEGSGGDNWLIAIAPYWFPTLCLLPLIALSIVDAEHVVWAQGLLGFTAVYHLTSTWRETHAEQTDLQKTGFAFAFMFLPSANIAAYAWLVLVTTQGYSAANEFLASWVSGTYTWVMSLT